MMRLPALGSPAAGILTTRAVEPWESPVVADDEPGGREMPLDLEASAGTEPHRTLLRIVHTLHDDPDEREVCAYDSPEFERREAVLAEFAAEDGLTDL